MNGRLALNDDEYNELQDRLRLPATPSPKVAEILREGNLCTEHTLGNLSCTLPRGHKYGPVFESSETRDRHADD